MKTYLTILGLSLAALLSGCASLTPQQKIALAGAESGNVYATYELGKATTPAAQVTTVKALTDLATELPNIPLGKVSAFQIGALQAELDQARSQIEILCAPLTDTECVNELTALRYSTRSRDADTTDTAIMFKIYREKLRAYPADIVVHVLRSNPEVSQFWPTWFELHDRLKTPAHRRKLIRDALFSDPPAAT